MNASFFRKLFILIVAVIILASVIVGIKLYVFAGVITAIVFLIPNVVFYIIILKMLKAGGNNESGK